MRNTIRKYGGLIAGAFIIALMGCSSSERSYAYYRDEIIGAYEKGNINRAIALSEDALKEYPEGGEHGMLLMFRGWVMTDYYNLYENEPKDRIIHGIESLRKAISHFPDSTEQIRSCYNFIVKKSVEFEVFDERTLEDARRMEILDSLHMMPILDGRKFLDPFNHYYLSRIHFALSSPRDSVLRHIDLAIEEEAEIDSSVSLGRFIDQRKTYLAYYDLQDDA